MEVSVPSESTSNDKIWHVLHRDPLLEEELIRSLPVSPTLCRILLNRGICNRDQAQRFLSPTLDDLYDPFLFDDMDVAVARTLKALQNAEKILVHGDYDVDGITSLVLMVRVLRIMGADVSWYVPHRQKEGYDIGIQAIDVAKERGVSLIITVDCGTSAVEAIQRARDVGIDVIVTDHHEVGPSVAPALALLNPRRPGCSYPFKELAGVGVAFKFAEALVQTCGYDVATYRRRFCDLAAIGTVADVVPLLDENRILVKYGMEELPRTGKKGLQALLSIAGLTGRPITSNSLAFGLAPRLNAAGRLDDASVAVELLLTTDQARAAELATKLEMQNRERQAEQERITNEALQQIISRQMLDKVKVFVLSSKGWHPGVVGIVANKITERYSRPTILIALDEDGEAGVGSARSIESFDLFEALMRCRHLLDRCGGHSRAAGLSIAVDKLPEFDEEINRIADEVLAETDLVPRLDVDCVLDFDLVSHDLARELQLLEPHGHGNREPLFVTERALILQKNRMGANGSHLKMRLARPSREPVECVAFGWGDVEDRFRVGGLIDLCYNIRINQFAGMEIVQAVLRDARSSEAHTGEPFPSRLV